ncbi:hypothetical protein DHW03_14025 [Pedobacter yonginense]|uniref:Uncharacterized protein n=1 Tax=Pedobacter yonginense TaxID=651869 RepID=A0A317EP95_9SPHI|nr:hypothetical protein [Pedobacter yonginense]PWS27116.1 hypothetical protein DHW03_14025 [Pedobacter yonginense]
MIKLKFIFLFICGMGLHLAQAQLSPKEIATLKLDLVKAVEDSRLTDSLSDKLNKLPNKSALVTAYAGTLEALKAKHAWNPYNKIKYVKLSIKTMERAVNLDKENMEIRFMRFSIQHFTPAFLGFSKELTIDRKEIVKHYQNNNFGLADAELIKNVANFMIQSNRCTPAEIKIFKKYI